MCLRTRQANQRVWLDIGNDVLQILRTVEKRRFCLVWVRNSLSAGATCGPQPGWAVATANLGMGGKTASPGARGKLSAQPFAASSLKAYPHVGRAIIPSKVLLVVWQGVAAGEGDQAAREGGEVHGKSDAVGVARLQSEVLQARQLCHPSRTSSVSPNTSPPSVLTPCCPPCRCTYAPLT